jgi:membrane fusion protein (multidrug efflux system)
VHKKLLLSALLLILAAGGLVYLGIQKNKSVAAAANAQSAAQPVKALKIEPQPFVRSYTLPGRITAATTGDIRPQVNGIITKRLFKEGSAVEKGQQLYQIDAAPYQAAYDSALANLKKAEANVKSIQARAERYAKLVEVDAISQQEYDDITAELATAEAEVAVAKAAVTVAEVDLNYTKVYAPISGQIGRSYVTEGALVTANQATPLAVITQLNPIYADLSLAVEDLLPLRQKLGDTPVTVTLQTDAAKQANLPEGTLLFSEVLVDETTGTTTLRAEFNNPDNMLLPGMFVRAQIQLPEEDVLLVPQEAAQRQPDSSLTVWEIKEDGTLTIQPIQAEQAIGSNWVVTSGISAGAVIMHAGFQKVQPGTKVTPNFPQPEPAPQQEEK